jgi:hypothetical protein
MSWSVSISMDLGEGDYSFFTEEMKMDNIVFIVLHCNRSFHRLNSWPVICPGADCIASTGSK